MPAPKRDLSPPESEPKIRKLDEDGDAMPSKVTLNALQTGNSPERTAAPRTKIKRSCSPEGNNSRPSSPLSNCSESVSDPPLKKAKLLSTSASSTVSSEKFNTSPKRTASTDSGSEASIGSSNVNYFSVRDDSKAEEPLSHPQQINDELPCSPSDSIQTDHSYGRISEITETDQDSTILQDFTSVVPRSQKGTKSMETNTGNTARSEPEPSNCVRIQALESQELSNNMPYSSADNMDILTSAVVSNQCDKEEHSSDPQTLLFSEKVPCPDESAVSNEKEGPCIITVFPTEGLIEVTTESVVEEVKCESEEKEYKTVVEETCIDSASKVMANKNSEPAQLIAISCIPDSEHSTLIAESVDNLQQTDSNVQFTFEEHVKMEPLQDQVSNAFTDFPNTVSEITLHENEDEQKTEAIPSSNECMSQNFLSNENELDNYRDNFVPQEIKEDSVMVKEKPYVENATILNGQLNAEIPTLSLEGIITSTVENQSLKPPIDRDMQSECSSVSRHNTNEPAPGMSLKTNVEPVTQKNRLAADSPATQEIVCSVATEDVQSKSNLNTTDLHFKELAVEASKVTQLRESEIHPCETNPYPETSEIIHQKVTTAAHEENSAASEHEAHVSGTVENDYVNVSDMGEINSEPKVSHGAAPACSTVMETNTTTEVTFDPSPNVCVHFQEVTETAVVTDDEHVELSSVAEGNAESVILHMENQPTTLPDVSSAAAEHQNDMMKMPSAKEEKNAPSKSISLNVVKVSEATHEKHNELVENLEVDTVSQTNKMPHVEISPNVEPHETTNVFTEQVEEVHESFISNAFTEHIEDVYTEYYTTTDVQSIANTEEISDPSSIVQVEDTNNGQQGTTSDPEISDEATVLSINKASSAECEDATKMEVQLSQQSTVEEKQTEVQKVITENLVDTDIQTNTVPEEIKVEPYVKMEQVAKHTVAFSSEERSDQTHLSDINSELMQTQSVAVNTLLDITTVSESQNTDSDHIETKDSEVRLMSETNQVTLITEDVPESEENGVTIIFGGQHEDIQWLKEQNETANQTELKTHENQIVYEPISSPESTTDGEVPTLTHKNDAVMLMHSNSADASQIMYSVSALSTNEEIGELHCKINDQDVSESYDVAEASIVPIGDSSATCPIDEKKVNGQSIQNEKKIERDIVMDSQPEMHGLSTEFVQMKKETSTTNCQKAKNEEYSTQEQKSENPTASGMLSAQECTTIENVQSSNAEYEKAAAISSKVEAPDVKLENTEEKSDVPDVVTALALAEQVQEITGPDVVTDISTEATVTIEMETPATDGTCEEYVILEPVPETTIHYDIVTQAVAEPDVSQDVRAESVAKPESILNEVQQASGVKDDINKESSQESQETEMEVETNVKSAEQVETICSPPQPTDVMEVTPADSSHATPDDVTETVVLSMEPPECEIMQDIQICEITVGGEEEQEEDSDIFIIEKSRESATEDVIPEKTEENDNQISKDKTALDNLKQDSAVTQKPESKTKEPEKPKKQEMNTQARTKARQAALAEQRAAAAKRQAKRQQLNLLALCQEIAEDIATDSMLLKKIEEEKQAAAAAAAKSETSKKEILLVNRQEEQPVDVATPTAEGGEVSTASVTPPEENPVTQACTENAEESKTAAETPKRRFFISQVNVPLKVHEKKKLTRYQRLRQVELQIEKMSWARVKKLKSDQANQMFSDMDWQASMSFSSFSVNNVDTPSQPVTSISKSPSASPTSSNISALNTEEPKVETPKPETTKSEPAKVDLPPSEATKELTVKKTEANKTESSQKEDSSAEPAKPGLRKSSRLSKIESSKVASPPAPTIKGKTTPKKVLPAVPPPMPNGLNNQSLKIEYKPYRPRPKYSPDDFELDDDPIPMAPPKASPQTKPIHQTGSNVQARPASQSTIPPKVTVSTQPKQAKVLTPAGQISSQSMPASSALTRAPAAQVQSKSTLATPSSSKLLPSTKTLQTTPVTTSPQTKVVVAPAPSKPTASSSPQIKSTSTASVKETTSTVKHSAESMATPAAPQDHAADAAKCKATEGVSIAAVAPKEDSKVSDGSQESEENKEAIKVHPVCKSETEETVTHKPPELCQDQTKPPNVETPMSDATLQKEIKKLKEADKDGSQTIIDAGQKHFGPVACSVCGMLYSAANPEDESQHLLFHNQFISAVKYVGWKKERILSEFHDGKIILVLPDDPKYALKKIEEIREMVDNDLGFQQVESKCPSKTKTFLFISNDKKVAGCLIAEHINEGYRVIEEPAPSGSEGEKMMFERQRAWCCSTTAEPAICGISRIWVVSTMRRQGIASRMLNCLRNNFIYGSNLSKDEIAFSDPTPDGKLFATHYFGTSQFLVYNFVNGTPATQTKTEKAEQV